MLSTYERWQRSRPVLDSLPGLNEGYSGNVVADWLTAAPDELLVELKAKLDGFDRQFSPLDCDERWLDYLASLCGFHGPYWDRAWPVGSKRRLLAASFNLIWPNYGTSKTLSFVLTSLNVTHSIREGQSFVIGRDEVGDRLGLIAWDYVIILPSSSFNTAAAKMAEKINKLYGPIWCTSTIIFDDTFFATPEYLAITADDLFAVDSLPTIVEL
jgi:Phage tail protein (Tail_P2_I)